MKKVILCPECNSDTTEVNWAVHSDGKKHKDYPKEIYERRPNSKRVFHEYRYFCSQCSKEWLHDTLFNYIQDIPKNSQFVYNKQKKVLVFNPRGK